jgi:hypothetical protein
MKKSYNSKDVASSLVCVEQVDKDGNLALTQRRSGRTVAARGTEKTWCSLMGKPPMLMMPALQTFTTVLEMAPATAFSIIGAEVQFNDELQYGFLLGGGDYLSVFDAYRIELMQVSYRPSYTIGVAGMNKMPNVYTVIDYDDSAGVAASVLQQYANCTVTTGEAVVRTFVPHANVSIGGQQGPVPAPWCDATSVNIPHYGAKAVIEATPGGATVFQAITHHVRARVQFRTTR